MAGSKQLQVSFFGLNLVLSLTGVAAIRLGSRTQRTIDYLRDVLKTLPPEPKLQAVCEKFARECENGMRPLGKNGLVTVVLSAACPGKPFRVAFVSNADWQARPPLAKARFSIDIREIRKPFWLISGLRDCVPAREEALLKAAARKIDALKSDPNVPNDEIAATLEQINAIAAQNSNDRVSEKCWVTSQFADGEGRRLTGVNSDDAEGSIPMVFGGFPDLNWEKKLKEHLGIPADQQLRYVQSAGAEDSNTNKISASFGKRTTR